jgi:hypothetical protein
MDQGLVKNAARMPFSTPASDHLPPLPTIQMPEQASFGGVSRKGLPERRTSNGNALAPAGTDDRDSYVEKDEGDLRRSHMHLTNYFNSAESSTNNSQHASRVTTPDQRPSELDGSDQPPTLTANIPSGTLELPSNEQKRFSYDNEYEKETHNKESLYSSPPSDMHAVAPVEAPSGQPQELYGSQFDGQHKELPDIQRDTIYEDHLGQHDSHHQNQNYELSGQDIQHQDQNYGQHEHDNQYDEQNYGQFDSHDQYNDGQQHYASTHTQDDLSASNLGYDINRLSVMGTRPLPPVDPNDTPEVRANRIRSFYKEYFDENAPGPRGQAVEYQEDHREEFMQYGEAPIYDPATDSYVMPFAQPVGRRAMTPPPRAPPRFQGARPRAGSSSSGQYAPRGRAFSNLSGRPGPKKILPPPKALNILPTPHMLREELLANPLDFAPPPTYRDRAMGSGRSSPVGGVRPYSPTVRAHTPLVSAFDDLPSMPSP